MGTIDLPKKPPASHAAAPNPRKPAGGLAKGKANVPAHDDLQQAVARIVEEETGNVMRYIAGKLPPGVSDSLDTRSLKEKLSRSIDRCYRQISGRLAASAGDEAAVGTRQSPDGIAQLLSSLGGANTFNSGEIEKSAGRKNINELEVHANNLLRQKTDVGAFLPADTAVSIVKCRFRDNALKPKTVTDVKLAVNITEPELIKAVFFGYAEAKYLIKDLICRQIIESVDRGGDRGIIGEEWITALLSDIDNAHFDLSNVRVNIAQSAGLEGARTGGFNMALNAFTGILERVKLNYQCIENSRDGREVVISEYDDSDPAGLPDERYSLRLRYLDEERLVDDRAAYNAQLSSFEQKVQHLWDLIEVNYHDSKPVFKVNDFEDLAKKNKGRIRDLLKHTGGEGAQEAPVPPVGVRFARMHERIKNMYEFLYPVERRILEDRLAWLERENFRLDFMINPHHLRPGLLIDIEITSIKRKKTTLNSMASALGEFLHGVYACFHDAAAAVLGS
jgi:hypothetical protein